MTQSVQSALIAFREIQSHDTDSSRTLQSDLRLRTVSPDPTIFTDISAGNAQILWYHWVNAHAYSIVCQTKRPIVFYLFIFFLLFFVCAAALVLHMWSSGQNNITWFGVKKRKHLSTEGRHHSCFLCTTADDIKLYIVTQLNNLNCINIHTVMILSFRTDMPSKQSDQGLHCLPFRLHRLNSLLYGRAT